MAPIKLTAEEAINESLVVAGLDAMSQGDDPYEAIQRLIEWEISVDRELAEDFLPVGSSRAASAIEAIANTVLGFAVSFFASLLILPLFGFDVTASQSFWITVFFTVISLARSYFIRRLFIRIHRWQAGE